MLLMGVNWSYVSSSLNKKLDGDSMF